VLVFTCNVFLHSPFHVLFSREHLMLQEILQAFACLFPSQPAAAKATSQSVIERGLRAALPTVDVLPPALSAALLVEEADDVEASAADDAAMQALLRDVMQTTTLAVPRRPFVRELSNALLLWRERGRFPWAGTATPPDLSETVPPDSSAYEPLTGLAVTAASTAAPEQLARLLVALGPMGILALLRVRRTVGTELLPPPSPVALCRSFLAPHSGTSRLSVGARALHKHWQRSESHVWGAGIRGNDQAKNARAAEVLARLLHEASWINIHSGVGDHEPVFEIRQRDGFGARWAADGTRFRGLLEPQAWDVQRRAAAAAAAATSTSAAAAAAHAAAAADAVGLATTSIATSSWDVCNLVREMRLESALCDEGRTLTVAGYASLMDEESARLTSPSLRGFRLGTVSGYCRVFNLVSIVNIRRGLATGRRLATATARPVEGARLRICLYEIELSELPELLSREARLRIGPARYVSDAGAAGEALLCSEFTDEEYMRERLQGSVEAYQDAVGQYYQGALYRADLLPVPAYVMLCLRAQRKAGADVLANFLDGSFLGDGRTTLREHLTAELESEGAAAVWPVEELRAILQACTP
jgi:hypothetical protein